MKLLKEIGELKNELYSVRRAARAIILRGDKIALMYVQKDNYYKLPGGGIEEGESIQEALIREVAEEANASIKIDRPIGFIIEYRNHFKQLQISYCFLTTYVEDDVWHKRTDEEERIGLSLNWVRLEEALTLIKTTEPKNYVGKLIRERDYEFLKEYERSLNT